MTVFPRFSSLYRLTFVLAMVVYENAAWKDGYYSIGRRCQVPIIRISRLIGQEYLHA
jgi:hypothetical protein